MPAERTPATGRTTTPPAVTVGDLLADKPDANLRRLPAETVGGAVIGGVTGAIIFGPVGALGGILIGAVLAAGTTRRFASAYR